MRTVFRDPQLESTFRRQGYVTMRLLDADRVARMADIYETLRCDLTEGWHADLFSRNLQYRREVHLQAGAVLAPVVLSLLNDFRNTANIFVVKEPSSATSIVPMHQDWTIIDYEHFISVNVVCPLVDTNSDNGWLMAAPGSH